LKSCSSFNIELEDPKKNAQQIIENISSGKSGIPLPYLQVYLDMLYRKDLIKTYGENLPDDPYPELYFSSEEIEELGSIENVLENFLSQQETRIDQLLKDKHPSFRAGTTHRILDTFVTNNGTKQALVFERKQRLIQVSENAPDVLKNVAPAILTDLLEELEKSRILHENATTRRWAEKTE
jgi:hypothetical protein